MTENEEDFQPGKHQGAIILVAAGKGLRVGGEIPKQYQKVQGKALIRYSLENLIKAAPNYAILPVIAAGAESLFADAAAGLRVMKPVIGGATRQASVLNGLEALKKNAEGATPATVMVHDAARPFVTAAVIQRLEAALNDAYQGALPGLPVADTLKRCDAKGAVEATLDRSGLWRAQTPQAFQFSVLFEAHQAGYEGVTDDIQLLEHHGGQARVVEGDENLFKVTTAQDFHRMEAFLMLNRPDVRVATGYDVHAFGPGDHVTLGGVSIPHTQGLVGHSDADVVLHAITDALLGAIAAGDIGDHFPPSDNTFKNMDSAIFLEKARDLVLARDGQIGHISVVIKAEKPKIGPHKPAIQQRIAAILGVKPDQISVQATTTEKLGYIGRMEGMAAMATATVRLPLKR